MTAATEDQTFDRVPLAVEHILLDVGEAETYTSSLGNPLFCQITIREDLDVDVNYTLSGRTFTFHESGGSGVKLAVSIYGRP